MDFKKIAEENKIYEVIVGSHAYGTNTPTSDLDVKGVFTLPPDVFISLFHRANEVEPNEDEEDKKYYELAKFLKLLAEQNPNIIDYLWAEERHVRFMHPAMKRLIAVRGKLLSQKVRHSFSGYAHQQLHRLMGHQKWINIQNSALEKLHILFQENKISSDWLSENFDSEMLRRLDVAGTNKSSGLTLEMDKVLMDESIGMISCNSPSMINFLTFIDENGLDQPDLNVIHSAVTNFTATKVNNHVYKLWEDSTGNLRRGILEPKATNVSYIDIELKKLLELKPKYRGTILVNLEAYKSATDRRKKFQDWRKKRNVVRAELEEKMGFDGKHAMHLVRLMRMAKEILTEGVVHVFRPDAQELLSIRNGAWPLDKIISYAQEMDKEVGEISKTSKLPYSVDKALIDQIYQDMLGELYGFDLRTKKK